MSHILTFSGRVERFRKRKSSNEKVAIIKDSHSYLKIEIPDKGYVIGQEVTINGTIIDVERGSQHLRVLPSVNIKWI